MALIVICENQPHNALESILRRVAYTLVPISIVLIKYFPIFGRTYGRWNGLEMWTGVATHKNGLGQLCAISAVFLFWALLREWRSGNLWTNRSQTLADVVVLGMAIFLLLGPGGGAYSATSIAITIFGVMTVVLLQSNALSRLVILNLKAVAACSVIAYLLFGNMLLEAFSSILDRNSDLTGRATDIWPAVVEAASERPLLGAGYAGVWGLGTELSSKVAVEQAHNGYLDVFLQLGLTGVVILSAFLLSYCGNVRRQASHGLQWARFGVFLLVSTLIYNNAESSLIEYTSYLWTILMFSMLVFSQSGVRGAVKNGREGYTFRGASRRRWSPYNSGQRQAGSPKI
jgi:O-antigen ligase